MVSIKRLKILERQSENLKMFKVLKNTKEYSLYVCVLGLYVLFIFISLKQNLKKL